MATPTANVAVSNPESPKADTTPGASHSTHTSHIVDADYGRRALFLVLKDIDTCKHNSSHPQYKYTSAILAGDSCIHHTLNDMIRKYDIKLVFNQVLRQPQASELYQRVTDLVRSRLGVHGEKKARRSTFRLWTIGSDIFHLHKLSAKRRTTIHSDLESASSRVEKAYKLPSYDPSITKTCVQEADSSPSFYDPAEIEPGDSSIKHGGSGGMADNDENETATELFTDPSAIISDTADHPRALSQGFLQHGATPQAGDISSAVEPWTTSRWANLPQNSVQQQLSSPGRGYISEEAIKGHKRRRVDDPVDETTVQASAAVEPAVDSAGSRMEILPQESTLQPQQQPIETLSGGENFERRKRRRVGDELDGTALPASTMIQSTSLRSDTSISQTLEREFKSNSNIATREVQCSYVVADTALPLSQLNRPPNVDPLVLAPSCGWSQHQMPLKERSLPTLWENQVHDRWEGLMLTAGRLVQYLAQSTGYGKKGGGFEHRAEQRMPLLQLPAGHPLKALYERSWGPSCEKSTDLLERQRVFTVRHGLTTLISAFLHENVMSKANALEMQIADGVARTSGRSAAALGEAGPNSNDVVQACRLEVKHLLAAAIQCIKEDSSELDSQVQSLVSSFWTVLLPQFMQMNAVTSFLYPPASTFSQSPEVDWYLDKLLRDALLLKLEIAASEYDHLVVWPAHDEEHQAESMERHGDPSVANIPNAFVAATLFPALKIRYRWVTGADCIFAAKAQVETFWRAPPVGVAAV